jgi:hypothetical protein
MKGEESWRIRMNEAIPDTVQKTDIVKCINSLALRWHGHIERTNNEKMPNR